MSRTAVLRRRDVLALPALICLLVLPLIPPFLPAAEPTSATPPRPSPPLPSAPRTSSAARLPPAQLPLSPQPNPPAQADPSQSGSSQSGSSQTDPSQIAPSQTDAAQIDPAPAADPLADEVRQLLLDLDADARPVRVAASKRLLELGPRILPLLPPPELLPNLAVRDAVGRVRDELEQRQARDSVQPTQLRLTSSQLDPQGQPLPRSVHEWSMLLSQQTGNRLDISRLPTAVQQTRLTLQPLEKPGPWHFWPLVDNLRRQVAARYDLDDIPGTLRLLPPAKPPQPRPEELAIGYAGSVRAAVTRCDLKAPLANRPDHRLLRMHLDLATEPRLRPLFLHYRANDFVLRTATSRPIPPLSPDASYEQAIGNGSRRTSLQLDYQWPDSDRSPTCDLTGQLDLTLAAGTEPIRFTQLRRMTDPARANVARRRGGVTVTVKKVQIQSINDQPAVRVRVLVAYDQGGPAFESHRTWVLHNEVYLETDRGQRLELNGGTETTLQADGAIGLEYLFQNLPTPLPELSFTYVAPSLILTHPVTLKIPQIPVTSPPTTKSPPNG